MQFVVVRKPRVVLTSTTMDDFPEEVQEFLDNFVDIVVDEMPNSFSPIRSISHHIDLIKGESIPNKEAYRLTPRGNEEVKNQVHKLLDKGLVRESLSPCDAGASQASQRGDNGQLYKRPTQILKLS
jgi:hypothetical protein